MQSTGSGSDGSTRARWARPWRLGDRLVDIAAKLDDGTDRGLADRVVGNTEFFRGNFAEARRRLDAMLAHAPPTQTVARTTRYLVNPNAISAMVRCQTLWIQGRFAEAAAAAAALVTDVTKAGHGFTQANAIALAACPIALLRGDWTALLDMPRFSTRRSP